MFRVENCFNGDNVEITSQNKGFKVVEYKKDLSVAPCTAATAYFSALMKCRKRQLAIEMDGSCGVTLQAGAMQWTVGNVGATSGIKSPMDLAKKLFRGKVTGESAVKPEYKGNGLIVCEPTYKHLIVMDLADWNGSVVLDDGMFCACESTMKQELVMRNNISSAVAGGEGLFNLGLSGSGIFCVESLSPQEELIEVYLDNDVLKIDGNMAVAWSSGLSFATERSGKTIVGSVVSGEGLVNVYRGTGKVLLAPVSTSAMVLRNTVSK